MKKIIETIQYHLSKCLLDLQTFGGSNQQSMVIATVITFWQALPFIA